MRHQQWGCESYESDKVCTNLRITIKQAKAKRVGDDMSLAYFETVVAPVSVKIDKKSITQQSFSDFDTYSLNLVNDILATLITSAFPTASSHSSLFLSCQDKRFDSKQHRVYQNDESFQQYSSNVVPE